MKSIVPVKWFAVSLFILLAGVAGMGFAAEEKKEAAHSKPIRVLFVGNSQVYYNHLHRIVEALAESAPKDWPRIITDARPSDRSVAGGSTLEKHWNRGSGKDTARGKITDEKWDYVIIQEFYSYASPESTDKYARLFHELIRENGAKMVLLCTSHVFDKYPKGFQEIHDAHVALGRTLQVPVAAAGRAWMIYWGDNSTEEQRLDLFDKDRGHPGKKGSYIYACTLYALLTGRSPVGLTNRISNEPENTITPAQAMKFQEAAWQAHQETNGKKPVNNK
ncbi:MAG: hypothetical protein K8T89_03320 [Planctomycetes bacterium]|nr:hypothetical protein [Planctomycetota bacterium]